MNVEEMKQPEQTAAKVEHRVAAPSGSGSRWGLLFVLLLAACALAYVVHSGIRSRVEASTALTRDTLSQSVATVQVVHPALSAPAEEIVLPGSIQAYTDTPIYARASGYLKRWNVDIGAHVKTGDLLAEIETPETDQQLQAARADLATAQANYALAQSTAERWRTLLKSDSVSKQETDEKIGDLNAKKAIADSASSNVRRLEQTQSFQRIYAPSMASLRRAIRMSAR